MKKTIWGMAITVCAISSAAWADGLGDLGVEDVLEDKKTFYVKAAYDIYMFTSEQEVNWSFGWDGYTDYYKQKDTSEMDGSLNGVTLYFGQLLAKGSWELSISYGFGTRDGDLVYKTGASEFEGYDWSGSGKTEQDDQLYAAKLVYQFEEFNDAGLISIVPFVDLSASMRNTERTDMHLYDIEAVYDTSINCYDFMGGGGVATRSFFGNFSTGIRVQGDIGFGGYEATRTEEFGYYIIEDLEGLAFTYRFLGTLYGDYYIWGGSFFGELGYMLQEMDADEFYDKSSGLYGRLGLRYFW